MERNANERLKQLRKSLKYKQGEFASMLGLKQGSYSDIERGRNGVSPNVLKVLEERFNVNIDWLKSGRGSMYMAHTPRMVDRVRDVMNHYRMGVMDFVNKLNMEKIAAQRLVLTINEGKDPSQEVINEICKAFPDVSRRYLITGDGNLLDRGYSALTYVNDQSELDMLREQVDLYRRMLAMMEQRNTELLRRLDEK